MINNLICVCTRKDLDTFTIASQYITQYIPAKHYRVIVPSGDVELFVLTISDSFEVVNEDSYIYIKEYLINCIGKNQYRFGWYFQQFIKLAELMRGNINSINLVWDADTVPLKPLFFISDNKLIYYLGDEHHKPYFELIRSLLGLPKIVKRSFIAQCFASRAGWVASFKNALEVRSGKLWYESIIDKINFSEASGFSEYETLGTYQYANFKDEMEFSKRRWLRYGNSVIGGVENLSSNKNKLSVKYDFVSFEVWDSKKARLRTVFRKLTGF